METKLATSDIIHDKEQNQFRMFIGKFLAVVDYNIRNDIMYLTHSEVPYHLQNNGYGKILLEKVFAHIEKHEVKSIAVCSYIRRVKRQNERWNKIIGEL